MKPRTLDLLKKLSNQKLNTLQQNLVRLQSEREDYVQRIDALNQQTQAERAYRDYVSDAFFQKIKDQKKECVAEIERLDKELHTLQKQVIEAWQKEEILKTLKYDGVG